VLEVFDGPLHVAEKEVGDAELQMQLFWRTIAGLEPFLQRLRHFAERAELRAPLGEPGAELLHRAGVAVLVFDQQGFQID
jgi:hypothetical protein